MYRRPRSRMSSISAPDNKASRPRHGASRAISTSAPSKKTRITRPRGHASHACTSSSASTATKRRRITRSPTRRCAARSRSIPISGLRLPAPVARASTAPNVFAGLFTALRFCGLLEESCAAHEQARQLDPKISTSAAHSYWMLGRYQEGLAAGDPDRDFGDEAFIHESMGNLDAAIAVFEDRAKRLEAAGGGGTAAFNFRIFEAFKSSMLGKPDALALFDVFYDFPDPEGLYYSGRSFARIGALEKALMMIEKAEKNGFFCYPFFVRDPWLDPLRGDPQFNEIGRRAETKWRDAKRAVESHPGSRVLSIGAK